MPNNFKESLNKFVGNREFLMSMLLISTQHLWRSHTFGHNDFGICVTKLRAPPLIILLFVAVIISIMPMLLKR